MCLPSTIPVPRTWEPLPSSSRPHRPQGPLPAPSQTERQQEIESGLPPQSGTQGAYWRHEGTPPQGLFLRLCLFHLLKWERGWGASVLVKGPRPPAPHADLETPRSLGPARQRVGAAVPIYLTRPPPAGHAVGSWAGKALGVGDTAP